MTATRSTRSVWGIMMLLVGLTACEAPSDPLLNNPADPLNPNFVNPPELVQDDFGDGKSSGWSLYGSGKVLTAPQSDGSDGYVYELGIDSKVFYTRNNSLSWTDYILNCDVLIRSGAWTLVLFRIQDQSNFYSFGLNPNEGILTLDVWSDGLRTTLGSHNYNLVNNHWHHVKVVVGGSTIACYVDTLATPVLKAVDASFSKGGIGLWSWQNKTMFDNVGVAGKMASQVYVGAVRTNGYAYDVELFGGRAYVADGIAGMTIVDVSTVASPRLMGNEHSSTKTAYGIKMRQSNGKYAYIANWDLGISIVDVSQSSNPISRPRTPTPGFAYGIELREKLVMAASGDSGLAIFYEDSPGSQLIFKGLWDSPGYAYDLYAVGDVVYLADGEAGLQVVDISDSTRPVLLAPLDTPGTAYDVVVSGDYAYVADGDSGLVVVDIANPSAPTVVARLPIAGLSRGIDIQDDYLFIAAGPRGLAVIDVSDPAMPGYAEEFQLNGFAYGVKVRESYAYVACGSAGLVIVTAISGL